MSVYTVFAVITSPCPCPSIYPYQRHTHTHTSKENIYMEFHDQELKDIPRTYIGTCLNGVGQACHGGLG